MEFEEADVGEFADVVGAGGLADAEQFGELTDRTEYDGTGSIDDAANFTGVMPTTPPDDTFPWLGDFRSDYQQTCHWEGTKLKCEPAKRS